MRFFDYTFCLIFALLIVFSSFAFGAVHAWSFAIAECGIFLLLIVWMAKEYALAGHADVAGGLDSATLARLALPFACFLAFVGIQLVPMPPAIVRTVSPAAYKVYAASLAGWPEREPYGDLRALEGGNTAAKESADEAEVVKNWRWRSLSIADSLTATALIKGIAYVSLLLIVAFYPFGANPIAQSFALYRFVIVTLIVAGLLVGVVAIAQQIWWNGKILWFYVPLDWKAPMTDLVPRASGPFVDPDHFAGFMCMILPLALLGALSGAFARGMRGAVIFRTTCAVIAAVVAGGILLSLSRAGWLGALLGVTGFLFLRPSWTERRGAHRQPAVSSWLRAHRKTTTFAAAGVVLLAALLIAGSTGRDEADIRLADTLTSGVGLLSRVRVWEDGLGLARDYPLTGIGLAAWPDIFKKYQSPPWSKTAFSEAHNDYLQTLTEVGLIGFALAIWCCAAIIARLIRRAPDNLSTVRSVYAAAVAAIAAMAAVEFFDFDLQIPAIAILLSVVVGLAIRTTRQDKPVAQLRLRRTRAVAAVAIAGALTMIAVSALQDRTDYPYNIRAPRTLAQARGILLAHPANAAGHIEFVKLAGSRMPVAFQLSELKAASELDPTDPYIRDQIARTLDVQGDSAGALREVTRSVFMSPEQSTHAYLAPNFAQQLSAAEQEAIEAGYRQAIATGNSRAREELASFYASVGRFDDEGALLEELANSADDPAEVDRLLLAAASAHEADGDDAKAERALRAALEAAPDDYAAYAGLISIAVNSRRDFAAAQAVVAEGIRNGVDPVRLNLALADVARGIGNDDLAEQAYKQAIRQSPYSVPLLMQVTRFYMDRGDSGEAIMTAQHAVDIAPQNAQARFNLGLAEEAGYRYSDADEAFAKAIALAPDNSFYRGYQQNFQRRLTKNSDAAGRSTE